LLVYGILKSHIGTAGTVLNFVLISNSVHANEYDENGETKIYKMMGKERVY